jgi:hypothetical protein
MNIIFIKTWSEIPAYFTGIAIYPNGAKQWLKEGKFHRHDGPAMEWLDGSKEWWVEGKLHKENSPACEYVDGHKEWWVRDKRHRLDGPAIEYVNGSKEWWVEGKQHREDGPAVEYVDGMKRWRLEGKHYLQINLKDYVVLDHDKGEYGLMWYRLLGKDKIIKCPDIPGLITK